MKNNRFRFIIRPHIVVYGTVTYGYDTYGKLETITRGSTIYSLTYDDWNRPETTRVGEEGSEATLSTNTYYPDGKLWKVTYANGFSAQYEYDNQDRVEKIWQAQDVYSADPDESAYVLTYEMIYNGEGDLYELRNYRTHRASFFDYDHAGRCMASKERAFTVTNGRITYGANLSSYGYQYDECNNLSKLTCSVLGSKWSTVYTYDNDNRPSTTTLASGKVITNTYDAIGRLTNRALGLNTTYNTALTYVPGNDTNKTTGLVATYQNGSDAAYNYTYDDVGNITEITQGTTSIGYVYDDANRLIRENNQVTNQTIVYDYENELWGNIRSRKIYAYTTIATDQLLAQTPSSTVNYAYTNTAWGDQLVEYNGQTITYDDMGNPTTYRGYTMTWRGKQLTSASNGTNSLTFEYNEDGLRQKKTVNNVVTDYFYNGSVLIGMQRGTMKFLFSYDAGGNVVSVKYITANDTNEYYYLRNAQGDIVKLIDANGVSVVEYTYDTWGKKVTTTGTLAGTLGLFQPFRYRGYVYDWETGLYYLESRYYDPTVGRFISADVLLSTGQGVMGHNCYAYCRNNPVNKKDVNGMQEMDATRPWGGSDRAGGFAPANILFSTRVEYYDDQHAFPISYLKFGLFGCIGNNGCGIIALDNAYIAAGYGDHLLELSLRSIIDPSFSTFGLGGLAGMSPIAMDRELRLSFGIGNVDTSRSSDSYDCFIVCYLYWFGGHYFFADNDGTNQFTVHNDPNVTQNGTMQDIINSINGYVFCVWGINY